jgi:hypothetical protein
MAKFNWDRETREARKRQRGFVPVWADDGTPGLEADDVGLGLDDHRDVEMALASMREVLRQFRAMSVTHRRQRASEFEYRLCSTRDVTESRLRTLGNQSVARLYRQAADALIADVRTQR